MPAASGRPRVDERVMGTGTRVRFVLLLVLMVVVGGSLMLGAILGYYVRNVMACDLASGMDPVYGSAFTNLERITSQAEAYNACKARFVQLPPWWVTYAWPVVVVTSVVVLFFALPIWKARSSRVVPLAKVDGQGEIRATLRNLLTEAGLARMPAVVVDPAATTTGAVVFGRNRSPTVRLDAGLLVRRATDPEGFRAVLLHELAHVRNGDVTITYVTVAVWRVFLALVLVPCLLLPAVTIVVALLSPYSSYVASYVPIVTRFVAYSAFVAVLIYLARADALRSREVHADLTAVRSGAHPRGWTVVPADEPDHGRARRLVSAFAELWRTHPRWDLRRDALQDPALLFGVRALPMFLTGAAAVLINMLVSNYTWQYGLGPAGLVDDPRTLLVVQLVATGLAAILIAGVAGTVVWRAMAYVVLTPKARVPSGLRAGLWLGSGMAVAQLLRNANVANQWLPDHPEVLVLIVLSGGVFGWWTAQCARFFLGRWRGRTIRPVMLMGLAAAILTLALGLELWWSTGGLVLSGQPFNLDALRESFAQVAIGPAAGQLSLLMTTAVIWSVLGNMADHFLVPIGVAALWVVPLLAWTTRPLTGANTWVYRALAPAGHRPAHPESPPLGLRPAHPEAAPSVRRMLLPALIGGAAGWVAFAGLQAYLHRWQSATSELAVSAFGWTYVAWALVALVVVAAAASAVAALLTDRYRLLVALAAAQTAILVGAAGMLVLASVDGCVEPLNTFQTSCGWRPGPAWATIDSVLAAAQVLGTVVAVVAAAAVSAVRRMSVSANRTMRKLHPSEPRGGRRLGVGALCAAVAVATAWQVSSRDTPTEQTAEAHVINTLASAEEAAGSGGYAAVQMEAWLNLGGAEHLARFYDVWIRLWPAVEEADAKLEATGRLDLSGVRPICADLQRAAQDADVYFDVPDSQAQEHWETLIAKAGDGGGRCVRASDRSELDPIVKALQVIRTAADAYEAANTRIKNVQRQVR